MTEFNDGKLKENKLFVELNHLSELLKKDRNELLDDFNKARTDKLKPKWVLDSNEGINCLKIGKIIKKPIRKS